MTPKDITAMFARLFVLWKPGKWSRQDHVYTALYDNSTVYVKALNIITCRLSYEDTSTRVAYQENLDFDEY